MEELVLDRMAIEDVGVNPQRMAEAIHQQLGGRSGAVPVREIALALDIVDIREERLTNLEAALLTTPERSYGSVLLNLNASPERRRFSLAHELLHFLNPLHEPTSADGFRCTRSDMSAMSAGGRHQRQEAEANTFAIELLAPRLRLKPYLRNLPSLESALRIAAQFELSKEAATRRYVQLHSECLAVAFTENGNLLYCERGPEFPGIALSRGQSSGLPQIAPGAVSDWEQVEASDWLRSADRVELSIQTLGQSAGRAISLLQAILPDDDQDLGVDDAHERFTRWDR